MKSLIIVGIIIFVIIVIKFMPRKSSGVWYDNVEAGKVTYANLSNDLKKKITIEDVNKILDLKFYYLRSIGLTSDSDVQHPNTPPVVDDVKMREYIIKESEKKGDLYKESDVKDVLQGEEIYIEQISQGNSLKK